MTFARAKLVIFINLFLFVVISLSLGGDAIKGFEHDGRYFLSSRGSLTEVSKTIFTVSMVHAVATLTSLVALVGASAARRFFYRRAKTP